MGNKKTNYRRNSRRRFREETGLPRHDSYRRSSWYKELVERMRSGQELCRACLRKHTEDNKLTLDHIIPVSMGGLGNRENLTILCEDCQKLKANKLWPFLISLAEEERQAKMGMHHNKPKPPHRRNLGGFSPVRLERELSTAEGKPEGPKPTPPSVTYDVQSTLASLLKRMHEAEARVEILEGKLRAYQEKPEGEQAKIMEFLKQFPGVKFNSGSIASNTGTVSMKISDKLKAMAGRGLIKFEKLDGLSAMFWYEEPRND